jgi:hypothetical protein
MAVVGTFTTTKLDVTAGVTSTGFQLTLTETTTNAVVTGTSPVGSLTVSIATPPAGTYSGSIVALDGAGTPIGPVITSSGTVVVVTGGALQIDVPATLALSLA